MEFSSICGWNHKCLENKANFDSYARDYYIFAILNFKKAK